MTPVAQHTQSQSIRLAEELRRKLSASLGEPVEVTLFGSQARGEATDESDIDVLVVLSHLDKSTMDELLEIAWQVGFEAGKVISVIPATFEEMKTLFFYPFFQMVKREGIPV